TSPAPKSQTELGALATPTWNDGVAKYAGTEDCITGPMPAGEEAFVGWYGSLATPPQIDNVYYVHVVWGQIADPCTGGSYVHFELGLPAGTDLAISGANPVKCYYQKPGGSSVPFTDGCPQTPGVGLYGGA